MLNPRFPGLFLKKLFIFPLDDIFNFNVKMYWPFYVLSLVDLVNAGAGVLVLQNPCNNYKRTSR